jgi:predicted nucleic acid-binding protein
LFSAALARTELIRAVAPNGAQAIADARDLLNRLDTVMLTRQLLDDAGTLLPPRLLSLDAIHLAAAQRAGDALRTVITYDARMLSAAADLGISTASPR